MLTTIQELEQEIDQFHKNIKESNELINILMSVVSMTRTQTESFDTHAKALHDELAKLPPELSDLVQKKIEDFVQAVHTEHQAYQSAAAQLMEGYADKVAKAETLIAEVPSALEIQLHNNRAENIVGLKQIQEQYASDLEKTNTAFSEQLQVVVERIQETPAKIQDGSAQQYAAFLQEFKKLMDARLAQLIETEKRVVELSQQLETKYDAFVAQLEATNMEQLNKYCQNMNKSINTKLNVALGGVAVAVIVSIISLFIYLSR